MKGIERMNQNAPNATELQFLTNYKKALDEDIAEAAKTVEETKSKVDSIYERLDRLEKLLTKMTEDS